MTEEQAKSLQRGDVVRDIAEDKEIIIEDFVLNEINGKLIIYLMKPGDNPNYSFALPYYLYELELILVAEAKQCICDIMVLMRVGCKCGKEKIR